MRYRSLALGESLTSLMTEHAHSRNELVGIDINIDGTRCHRVIYVLEQARFIVSCEGRNLPILITS